MTMSILAAWGLDSVESCLDQYMRVRRVQEKGQGKEERGKGKGKEKGRKKPEAPGNKPEVTIPEVSERLTASRVFSS